MTCPKCLALINFEDITFREDLDGESIIIDIHCYACDSVHFTVVTVDKWAFKNEVDFRDEFLYNP